jgi:hypothetical protein
VKGYAARRAVQKQFAPTQCEKCSGKGINHKENAMNRRCNLFLILAFLMGLLAIPVKSYAYRSVDDAISWAENQIGSGAYYHGGYNWCWTFARDTYGGAAISGVGSAIAAWNYNGALLGPRHADNNRPLA